MKNLPKLLRGLCGLALVAAIYAGISKALGSAQKEARQLAMATTGAFTWYVVQGLGENFGLVGEVHMTPLIGALLGHLCARYDALSESDYEYQLESVRGAAAPSVIPAV